MNRYYLMMLMLLGSFTFLSADEPPTLVQSAKKGSVQSVTDAVNAGADINARDEHGATALMWGALRGYREIVVTLLKVKADPDICDDRGQTALHWAAMRGKTDIVKLLLEAGADRSKTDASGKDAAAAALDNGYYDLSTLIKKTAQTAGKISAKPDAAASLPPPDKKKEPAAVIETGRDAVPLAEYYPAKTGDAWTMRCIPTDIDTVFYVLESSDKESVIQCESKRNGKRVDYYRQTVNRENDLLKVMTPGRSEVVLKKPIETGTKWFIERGGIVFTRQIVQTDALVSFAGKEYSCVVVRDIIPSTEKAKRKGAGLRKEVHYHCYAAGVGYLGTKTASFEKDGDVEHIPSFAEIPSWYLVRQRSAN